MTGGDGVALNEILVEEDFTAWNLGADDLEKLPELIGDILAQAAIVAPCLEAADFSYARAAKAVLREAVLRRLDAGTGAVTTQHQGTGPFQHSETIDNRANRGILRPNDIRELQLLCTLQSGAADDLQAGALNLDPQDGIPLTGRLVDRPDLWFQLNVPWETLP